jgi:hypothetical protein
MEWFNTWLENLHSDDSLPAVVGLLYGECQDLDRYLWNRGAFDFVNKKPDDFRDLTITYIKLFKSGAYDRKKVRDRKLGFIAR